jgi:signal transduction histidine kinase
VLGLALATGAIGISLFLLATRSALDPIDSLTEATRRVRDGDLKSRVPVLSGDELGTLAHSFNQMLDGLREREALRADLRESRARIVATADAERRRLERDLHDGAQQHLVLMNLKLATADRLIEKDPAAARAVHAELRHDLRRALEELRELAHGIYPQVLQADGLPGALREAVGRAAIPATLECDRIERLRPEVEAAVYFCCLEALQNASKHAGENASATVRLSKTDGMLRFEVEDTGGGFDLATREQSAGLQNMSDRVGALGGRLEITSAPGQGTTISGAIAVETEDRSEVDRGDGAA